MTELEPSSTSNEKVGSGVSPKGTSPEAMTTYITRALETCTVTSDLVSPRNR